jgi:signal transduction histidine kinase
VLSDHGLCAALEALASRAPVPVQVTGELEEKLQPAVEAAAYFVTSEALANMAKYSQATAAFVDVAVEQGRLRLCVRDDGVGGADPDQGSGLSGLRDRVDALDGRLELDSPPGEGTTLTIEIPV